MSKPKNESDLDGQMAMQTVVQSLPRESSERVLACAQWMMQDITHGSRWKVKDLATQLERKPESAQFGFEMAEINEILEREKGYHLSTRGSHGQEYFAEALNRSGNIMATMNRNAMKLLKRASIFGHSVIANHGAGLSESEKRRLEKQSQILAMRYVLASRLK